MLSVVAPARDEQCSLFVQGGVNKKSFIESATWSVVESRESIYKKKKVNKKF